MLFYIRGLPDLDGIIEPPASTGGYESEEVEKTDVGGMRLHAYYWECWR